MVKEKNSTPLASVVVLNWNGKAIIEPCLKALLKQSYSNLELIIVDNGSTDGSADFLKQKYPQFKLIVNEKNLFFSGGVNVGIKAAKGKYTALLNNDAEPNPNWISDIMSVMEADENIGITAPKSLKTATRNGKHLIDTAGDFMSKWGIFSPRGRDEIDNGQYDKAEEVFSACAGMAVYRSELFNKIGYFDEWFKAYYEDSDIGFRARLAGYKVWYQPSAVVYHQVGATNDYQSPLVRYNSIKNIAALYYKDMPAKLFFKYLPRFLVIEALLFAGAVKAGAGWHAIKANFAFLGHLPTVLIQRHEIQKNRKVSSAEVEEWLTDKWPLKTKVIEKLKKKR